MGKADDLKSQIGSGLKDSASSLRKATAPENGTQKGLERDRRSFLIDADLISTNPQVRENFDDEEIQRLAESMATHGQLQAVVVCRNTDGGYQLIAGERRLRAARVSGLKQLRCELFEEEFSHENILEIQMVENLLRSDLNPIEEARGFQSLMKRHGWTMSKIADRLGRNKSTISRAISLLRLPTELIEKVNTGKLPPRVARELARLDSASEQTAVVGKYLDKEFKSADTSRVVNKNEFVPDAGLPLSHPNTETENEGAAPSVTEYTTIHATITVKHNKPNPTKGELQAELLAAVKQIGRSCTRLSKN